MQRLKKQGENKYEKQITIGVGDTSTIAREFIDVWKRAEHGEAVQEKNWLYFENFELLLKTWTPGRWSLLKRLHANGPMSIRALANDLGRDYKNVYTDYLEWLQARLYRKISQNGRRCGC